MKIKLIKHKILIVIFSLIIVLMTNGSAQDMQVPANLQAALFKKIFSFDKTLQSKGNIEVAVLGNSGDAVVAAFKEAGINIKSAGGDQIPAGASVVYIMPGLTTTKQQTASKGILSISGVSSYAEEGKVSIGIGTEGGKPKIIINMAQLKAEGHEVSADLLQIAKVIQ